MTNLPGYDEWLQSEPEPTTACCVCNEQHVKVRRHIVSGIETFVCRECERDPDAEREERMERKRDA